jgi:hypothetical protein
MSLYRHTLTGEVREYTGEFISSHPKAQLWEPYTRPIAPPDPDPLITKDELIRNAIASGRLAALRTAVSGMTQVEQFAFANLSYFTKEDGLYERLRNHA